MARGVGCERRIESGVELWRLRVGDTTADVAPALGLCVTSWICGGIERLALPSDLATFARSAKTGGVPLLYPWANRLRSDRYHWGGKDVAVTDAPGLKRDANGLPIHGCLVRHHWQDIKHAILGDGILVAGDLAWSPELPAFAAFPFAHQLSVGIVLCERSLNCVCRVTALDPTPIAFGWHPYLRLPGPRQAVTLQLPSRERVGLDRALLPVRSGELLAVEPTLPEDRSPLGDRTFDDLFRVPARCVAGLSGPEGTIHLRFHGGYRFLQVYAPAGSDFLCLEPMTAPGAALSDGHDLPSRGHLGSFDATFEIVVR